MNNDFKTPVAALGPSTSTVGIVIFPDLLEDWLEHIDISFDAFIQEMMGSWIFGYFESLKLTGIEPVMIAVSNHVTKNTRFVHRPTGTTICLLPATRLYKLLRWIRQSIEGFTFVGSRWIKGGLRVLSEYLSTPLLSFSRELRDSSYASILVQDYETPRFDMTVLVGRLMGIPVYGTFQGAGPCRKIFHAIRSRALRNCGGLIIAAQTEAERVKKCYGLPASKVTRIYNPLNVSSWRPIDKRRARAELGVPPDAEVAIWHGRIAIDQKGLDILLAAWEQVCKSRPTADLRLILIGKGPDSQELDSIIQERDVRGVLRINEWVHDTTVLRQYLGCADVFVFASRYEGFALAPMEAMACGLPVVASAANGMQDILEEGWNSGGIVVPCNDPHALSGGILRLLDNAAWREEISRRAQSRIETMFSTNAVDSNTELMSTGAWQLSAPMACTTGNLIRLLFDGGKWDETGRTAL